MRQKKDKVQLSEEDELRHRQLRESLKSQPPVRDSKDPLQIAWTTDAKKQPKNAVSAGH